MKKIKSYKNFINETLITEVVDPITLAFAIAGVGIVFGPEVMKAYRSRKISKASMSDLKKMLSKAKAKVKKYERQGLDHDAAEAQSEVDHIEARIDDLSREMDSDEKIIRNFEKDKRTQKDLEQELKNVDPEILKRALKDAKKETLKLK